MSERFRSGLWNDGVTEKAERFRPERYVVGYISLWKAHHPFDEDRIETTVGIYGVGSGSSGDEFPPSNGSGELSKSSNVDAIIWGKSQRLYP